MKEGGWNGWLLAACPKVRGGAIDFVAWRHETVQRLWFGGMRHEAVQRDLFELFELCVCQCSLLA